MSVAVLEESGLDGRDTEVARQLEGALRLAARALERPCELGWLDAEGRPTWLRAGDAPASSWGWLVDGDAAIPPNVAALRDRQGRLLGGIAADPGEVPARLLALAPELADVLAAVLADQERFAAHDALIELSSQLHADELNTDEILRLIVERARKLIGVDVTWLGLIDPQNRVAIQVAAGARSPEFVDMWIDVGHGIGGLAVKERRTVVVPDHRLYQPNSTDLVIQTLGAEGVVSVLCAPLLFDGGAIGALYGGSRELTSFSETTIAVFTALATQAAVSIVNSRLYGALAEKNVLLERTLSLHRRLNDAALAGADGHAIAGEVARLIERPVIVVRETAKPRAWRYEPSPEPGAVPPRVDACAGDMFGGGVAIRAGEERLGTIGVLGDAPLSDFDRNALEQGATIMALEIVKERVAWEAEWRLRGELLEEILQERGEPGEGLQLRAAQFGVDLDACWTLAVLEPAAGATADLEPIVRTALHRGTGDGRVLVAKRGDRVLVALDAAGGSPAEIIEQVLAKAQRAGVPVIAGLSAARRELPIALNEAEAVLRLARENQRSGLVTFDALGPLRYFLNTPGTADMSAMVDNVLGELADYDRRRNGELVRTLRAYLRSGGHQPTAAAECHIHVSTLKYRLGRIAELLGRPVSDPRAQFELGLAFSTLDALGSLGLSTEEIFTGRPSSTG
ncbi:MAG TPA: helix-turn-helix domain-containing protein [Solirubrobacteraceae bacterium]|jgi:sugar diacid utilization regulator/putative methionine-R-sulfoxide reductase with GAF domain|nr:helix-turn-helix domain-containing protein [Solirubrobacteraceae bacterium]